MAVEPGRELSSINFEAMLGGPLIAVVNAQAQAAMSSVNFIKAVGFKPGNADDPTKAQTGDPIYVSFKYPKEIAAFEPAVAAVAAVVQVGDPNYPKGMKPHANAAPDAPANDGDPAHAAGFPAYVAPVPAVPAKAAVPAQFAVMMLEVPILTMLPIPFIRIEETTIDFNAKINSVEETKTDETFKLNASIDAKVQYPPLFSVATVKLKVSTSFQKNTQSGTKVDKTYSMAVHIRAVQDEMPAGMEKILGILEDAIKSQPMKQPTPVEV